MTAAKIESVRIRGFRSLADVELSNLRNANVLIGANGSGKSNFIRFFEMMSWMLRSRRLGEFVELQGGADDQLHKGNRVTPRMEAELALRTETGRNDYRFALAHAHPDRFVFTEEAYRFNASDRPGEAPWQHAPSGRSEAAIVDMAQTPPPGVNPTTARVVVHLLRNCAVYQFHDTSDTSHFKKRWDADDNNYLRTHGGNLAAVLHRLEQEDLQRFDLISRHIRRALPVFDRFQIDVSYGKVSLRWKAAGTDKSFGAHLTSDGSLRFFALVTLLNLPPEMLPNVLLLDEPELGLHPATVALVGGMIKALSVDRQIIVATQSPLLVDASISRKSSSWILTMDAPRSTGRMRTGTGAGSTKASCRVRCGRRTSSEGARDTSGRVGGRTDRRGIRQAGSCRSLEGKACRVDADRARPGSGQIWRRKRVFGSTRVGNGLVAAVLRCRDFIGRLLRVSPPGRPIGRDLEAHLREEIARQIGPRRDETKVVPYVQRHEFEGLLFSNVEVFAEQVDFPVTCRGELQAVRAQFTTPEDINDDPQTAPSKRIANVIPRYRKPLHGPLLAGKIGLDRIRAECPRFHDWVMRLESLAD